MTSNNKRSFSFQIKTNTSIKKPKIFSSQDSDSESEEAPPKKKEVKEEISSSADSHDIEKIPIPSEVEREKIEKLAKFVVKNGLHFENITKERNPDKFKFLFDTQSSEYKYYQWKKNQLLVQDTLKDPLPWSSSSSTQNTSYNSVPTKSGTPFSLEVASNKGISSTPEGVPQALPYTTTGNHNETNFYPTPILQTPPPLLPQQFLHIPSSFSSSYSSSFSNTQSPPISLSQQSKKFQEVLSSKRKSKFEEIPTKGADEGNNEEDENGEEKEMDSLEKMNLHFSAIAEKNQSQTQKNNSNGKRSHHIGDFLPTEELEKYVGNSKNEPQSINNSKGGNAIDSSNIGHQLLTKMGWKEGGGLGSNKQGGVEPIFATQPKNDNLGVGAISSTQITSDDDIYEQYKKRMMAAYKYRPNPLNNPRKPYY